MMHSDGCLLGAEETYKIPLPTVICANEPERAPSSQTLTGTRKRRFFFKTSLPPAEDPRLFSPLEDQLL